MTISLELAAAGLTHGDITEDNDCPLLKIHQYPIAWHERVGSHEPFLHQWLTSGRISLVRAQQRQSQLLHYYDCDGCIMSRRQYFATILCLLALAFFPSSLLRCSLRPRLGGIGLTLNHIFFAALATMNFCIHCPSFERVTSLVKAESSICLKV